MDNNTEKIAYITIKGPNNPKNDPLGSSGDYISHTKPTNSEIAKEVSEMLPVNPNTEIELLGDEQPKDDKIAHVRELIERAAKEQNISPKEIYEKMKTGEEIKFKKTLRIP